MRTSQWVLRATPESVGPVIYHCVSRVVDRRFAFQADEKEKLRMGEIPFGRMLECKVRYFTAGAVIGSREFVNEVFESSRGRFGPKRKDGARRLNGNASAAAGMLWSLRDLQKA